MKKYLCAFLAAALCFCSCGCAENTSDNEPVFVPDTTQAATAAPSDGQFVKLSAEDFSDVNVGITYIDDKLPDFIHSVHASDLDFGSHSSPCTADDVNDKFLRSEEQYGSDYESYQKYLKSYYSLRSEPSSGNVVSFLRKDDSLFLLVSFDPFCGCHDWAVFEYSVSSGDLRTIFSCSDLEQSFCPMDILCYDGKLIVQQRSAEDEYRIISIDPASGKSETLVSGDNARIFFADDDNLILYSQLLDENAQSDIESAISSFLPKNTTLYRYDNGQITELHNTDQFIEPSIVYDGDIISLSGNYAYGSVMISGDSIHTGYFAGADPEQVLTVETPDYFLDTGLRNARFISASHDKVIVSDQSFNELDSSYESLFIYDLNNHTRSVFNINNRESLLCCGDNLFIEKWGYSFDSMYLLVPELGCAFAVGSILDFSLSPFLSNSSDIIFSLHDNNNHFDTTDQILYWYDLN